MTVLETNSIQEIGVDYVTATTTARHSETCLDSFGRWVVNEEIKRGERHRPFRFAGYVGYSTPSATYGRRHDGGIARFSGPLANEYWDQAVMLSTNVSRIDLQVTVRPECGPAQRLRNHYLEIRRPVSRRGKPRTFKLYVGPHGPEALTLGARSSERFGRIYDKGVESKLAHYMGSLRYELELKGAHALSVARRLVEEREQQEYIAVVIVQFLEVNKMKLYELAGFSISEKRDKPLLPAITIGPKAPVRRLKWLAVQVAPSVRDLVRLGHLDQVLIALGLNELVELGPKVRDSVWSNPINWEER